MKIPEVLSNINLEEEQVKALDQFFESWAKDMKASIEEDLTKKGKIKPSKNMISKKDAEKAFNLFKEDTEKAFNLAKQEWQKEYSELVEEKEQQYTESMAKAMQDIYEELEARVQDDFKHSPEYKAFEQIKSAVLPVVISEDQKELLEKIKNIEEKEQLLEQEQKTLSKDQVISTLLQDFPKEYSETVKKFISKAKDEEEVYERFNTIVEMIDKGAITTNGQISESEEPISPDKKAIFKRKIKQSKQASGRKTSVRPVLESATGKERKPVQKKKDGKSGLTSFEEQVLRMAFPQSI